MAKLYWLHNDGAKLTIVVIDTETTGFGHTKWRDDAIIQVGIAYREKSGALITWQSYCKPAERYIENADPEALRINSITPELIRASYHEDYVANQLRGILANLESCELRSFNKSFDRPFLAKTPWLLDEFNWGDCIMLAATEEGKRWPKLKVACERFGIDTAGPLHSAGHDAKLAYLLMEALERKNQLELSSAVNAKE